MSQPNRRRLHRSQLRASILSTALSLSLLGCTGLNVPSGILGAVTGASPGAQNPGGKGSSLVTVAPLATVAPLTVTQPSLKQAAGLQGYRTQGTTASTYVEVPVANARVEATPTTGGPHIVGYTGADGKVNLKLEVNKVYVIAASFKDLSGKSREFKTFAKMDKPTSSAATPTAVPLNVSTTIAAATVIASRGSDLKQVDVAKVLAAATVIQQVLQAKPDSLATVLTNIDPNKADSITKAVTAISLVAKTVVISTPGSTMTVDPLAALNAAKTAVDKTVSTKPTGVETKVAVPDGADANAIAEQEAEHQSEAEPDDTDSPDADNPSSNPSTHPSTHPSANPGASPDTGASSNPNSDIPSLTSFALDANPTLNVYIPFGADDDGDFVDDGFPNTADYSATTVLSDGSELDAADWAIVSGGQDGKIDITGGHLRVAPGAAAGTVVLHANPILEGSAGVNLTVRVWPTPPQSLSLDAPVDSELFVPADGTKAGDNNLQHPSSVKLIPTLTWAHDPGGSAPLRWESLTPYVSVSSDGTVTVKSGAKAGTATIRVSTVAPSGAPSGYPVRSATLQLTVQRAGELGVVVQ